MAGTQSSGSVLIRRLLTSVCSRCHHGRLGHVLGASSVGGQHKSPEYPQRRQMSSLGESYILKSPLQDVEIPESPFLAHFVLEKWNSFGKKTALINSATDRHYTYDELKDIIAKVGSGLVRRGFKKGDVVTIFLSNCMEFVFIYLGALSVGMTVSAVNPLYTPDELEYAVKLAETKLLVVSDTTAEVARQALAKFPIENVCCVSGSEGFLSFADLLNDDGKCFPESVDFDSKNDVAALLYSSGTTGFPKGVMLTNFSLVANLNQVVTPHCLAYGHDDVSLCTLPMFHAFGQIVILLSSLRVGGTVVVSERFDPVEYLDQIQKYRPTFLHVVPPMLVLLAKHPLVPKCDFSSANHVFSAAAPTSEGVIEQARERMRSDAVFRQGYGLTEASPGLCITTPTNPRPGTVGPPIHNTEIKIRDVATNSLVGPNQEGEICARGPQIMKGYFKNDKATKETVIDGWLHTGDIGYYNDESHIVVTDRLKELIKYKGLQVAPAELEALLLTHPDVADVAVIGKPDDMAGELPRAYVVLKPGKTNVEEDIQNFVKDRAAPYKQLRGGVVFRSEVPKSASGKILRRVLKDELKSEG